MKLRRFFQQRMAFLGRKVVQEALVTLEKVRVIAYRHGNSPDAGDPQMGTDPNATV